VNKAREFFEKQYIARTKKSRQMYEEAKKYLAGGVPGGARFRRPYPLYMREAKGSKLWDIDGNEYIDLLMGAGPDILGHSPPAVIAAVKERLDKGTVMQDNPAYLWNGTAPVCELRVRGCPHRFAGGPGLHWQRQVCQV